MGYVNIHAGGPNPTSVKITDSETGAEIKNISAIRFYWTARDVLMVNLEIYGHEIEAENIPAEIVTLCPYCQHSYAEAERLQEALSHLENNPTALYPEQETFPGVDLRTFQEGDGHGLR